MTRLTHREREVIYHTAHGKSYEEISEILGIGRETVKTHVFNARIRLDAHNLSQVIAISVAKGLVTI